MFTIIPSLVLVLVLVLVLPLAAPSVLTPSTSQELQVGGHRTQRDTKQDTIKVVISEGCADQQDSSDDGLRGKEIDLAPGSPLVLTHKIKLVPSPSGSGPGSCGCEADFGALRERLESLEREVSALREKCGGADGGCCTSKESKGAGCSIKSGDECPNECSDQGRCVDGKCVCFSGYSGPDCSETNCTGNCNNSGRCVNGQCVCDPGFTGPDCSHRSCPDNCNSRGRCVNGRCVCNSGFTGPSCSEESCPRSCNNRGRCVNGECVCNPGFSGPDCSKRACPDNCNDHGRCVNGKCVCNSGFTGADCSEHSCPGNCNNRGRCVKGQCVCKPGFTGAGCSDQTCPGNCNNRGRCVKGQCVCDDGFAGSDCSGSACPNDCNDRGQCVNGKCVCDSEFTGADCSDKRCPGNCNNRGRCVTGQCVCGDGFTGADCSERTCSNNCSSHGKCVNGKCVCTVGFAGQDCSVIDCPSNCSNKGRCVRGRCVCRRGFTGQDCSLCEEGKTGPSCDIVMSGVSQLRTRDITETSVSLVWSPPPVQYDSYHVTFSSQKESDQQITAQVEGSLSTFTQTGLAAGHEYTVTVTGEADGRRGAQSSAKFMTLISGPTNLQVVKTTATSAVLQWEKSQGDIDRYRLTVTPRDGAEESQEISVPADRNSAHVLQLQAGHVYDIILVAGKGTSRSEPVTTQAVPGKTFPRVTTAALNMQVTLAPGLNVGNTEQFNPSPEVQVFNQKGRREDEGEPDSGKLGGFDRPNRDSSTSVIARTTPLVSRTMARNSTNVRPTLSKKPNVPGHIRFNTTRFVPLNPNTNPKDRKVGSASFGEKKTAPLVPRKQASPRLGDKEKSLTVSNPGVERTSSKMRDDRIPALTIGTGSETNRQSSLEEPTEKPNASMAGQENDFRTSPMTSEPNRTVQSQDKKCMNKVKVTHVRLPLKERGSGCREEEKMVVQSTDQSSDVGLSETDSLPHVGESDPDSSSHLLHKLLADTFNSLNITTFSVHLTKASNLPVGADTVRKQILTELKPLSSFSSLPASASSSSQLPHHSSSQLSSASSSSSSSSLSLVSRSRVSSLSTTTSQTYLIPTFSPLLASQLPSSSSLSSSSSSSSPSSSLSSSSSSKTDKSDSAGLGKLVHDNIPTTVGPSKDMNLQPSRGSGVPRLRLTSPKHGHVGHPFQKPGSSQNRTFQNLRIPHRPPLRFNSFPRRETVTRHASSEESLLVGVNVPAVGASQDGVNTSESSGFEQNQKKLLAERRQIPVPPRGGYLRRRFTHFKNRTRPNLRLLTLNSKTERQKELSPAEMPDSLSPPVSKDSYSAEGAVPEEPKQEGRYGTRRSMISMSTGLNQTVRGSRMPPPHRPTAKVGYFRRSHERGGLSTNKTHMNLSPSQHPHRRLMHRPSIPTKIHEGSSITAGSPITQEQGVPRSTQEARQSGDKETAHVITSGQRENNDTTIRPQTDELESSGNVLVQTTKSKEEETSNPESTSDSGIKIERTAAGTVNQVEPTIGPSASVLGASIPITLVNKQLPTRSVAAQHRTPLKHYISGSRRGEDPNSKPEQTRHATSKPVKGPVSSSGVTREPLDFVGVRNRTSNGFTLTWDSPEGKYKNFVVTTQEVVKDKDPEQKEGRKDPQGEQDDFKNQEERKHQPEHRNAEDENRLPQIPWKQSSTAVKPATEHDKSLTKVLPGSARSLQFEDLFPQTEYTVTLLGKSPGLLSRLHKLVISTGPEAPSSIFFSKVTENSLTVSWTKPKTPVSGFKVTYTHTDDGEPMSVSVNSENSTLGLSQLSPGSSYEVSVISTLGLDESDPIKELVMTRPDPPTDFQAVNVTDTKALLLWRPALAAIDKYAIVYGSGTDSELRVSVSGNEAEQQLSSLQESTTYTVTITSQLGSLESSSATTTFTTTSGSARDEDSPRDLQANNLTPRTALLSWKPPSQPFGSYRLTYQSEGEETKEVIVDASVTKYNLTRLYPGSNYRVELQAKRGGRYMSAVSTEFSTGTLRFPFPSDCSQELLNGVRTSGKVEIFPQGKLGTPLVVYCDMETEGGGWMVFQRRKDGSVNFFRRWDEYVRGFGDLNGEFWLGLNNLHNLTAMTAMSLRVDLRDGHESVFAKYSTFDVSKKNYRLTVGGYSGTAGDSLSYHNSRIFSTRDRDLAQSITRCAMSYRGGWWYKNCHEANLNGLYGVNTKHQGVIWTAWKGKDYSIPFTEMKMRPAAFRPPTRG